MHSIVNAVANFEQNLNPVDWYPFASYVSGRIRIIAGCIEVIAGMVFTILKSLHVLLSNRGTFSFALGRGINYSCHGFANIARGCLALAPGLNLLLYVHDKYLGRMNYIEETVQTGVYPIMTAYRFAED